MNDADAVVRTHRPSWLDHLDIVAEVEELRAAYSGDDLCVATELCDRHPSGDTAFIVVDRDAQGITIRGAKMLGTGAIMANEILVTCIQPLQPGDERYAVSFAVPLNAPGLKILSRKSYEASARSVFDNPVSSRYDENDALLYFDDGSERAFIAVTATPSTSTLYRPRSTVRTRPTGRSS